jgi:hypothetical protein
MKKVLDQELEKKIKGMSATEVIATIKELQDASGIKICQNINKEDVAYREVK